MQRLVRYAERLHFMLAERQRLDHLGKRMDDAKLRRQRSHDVVLLVSSAQRGFELNRIATMSAPRFLESHPPQSIGGGKQIFGRSSRERQTTLSALARGYTIGIGDHRHHHRLDLLGCAASLEALFHRHGSGVVDMLHRGQFLGQSEPPINAKS